MEDMIKVEKEEDSYFPDFSDIYDENFQFWDFMSQKDMNTVQSFDEDSSENLFSKATPDDLSRPKGEETSTFWDFLSSKTEKSPELPSHYGPIFNSPDDKPHSSQNTHCSNSQESHCDKGPVPDEFWDFLNSSTDSLLTNSNTKKQNEWSGSFTDTIPDSKLPRISSVFSIKSSLEIPQNISLTVNSGAEVTDLSSVTDNNVMSGSKVTDLSSVTDNNVMSGSKVTDLSSVTDNNVMSGSKVTDLSSVTDNNVMIGSKVSYLTDASEAKFQNPLQCSTTHSFQAVENTAKTNKSIVSPSQHFLKDAPPFISATQNLELKTKKCAERIPVQIAERTIQNAHFNNVPLYVSLPDTLQKPNYSQYLIIVNNAHLTRPTSNGDASSKNHATAQSSNPQKHSLNVEENNFESDLQLAGLRNNHILNMCKTESPFEQNNSESKCFLPVSPLNEETLQMISNRIKQNSSAKTVNKQIVRKDQRKPIKCISLGRYKNAMQQTNTPISVEAFETSAENTSPKSTWKVDGKSHASTPFVEVVSDKNPLGEKNASQKHSFLPLTFSQFSKEQQFTFDHLAKQNGASSSYQAKEVYDPYEVPSRCLLMNGGIAPVQKVLILGESRPNKILLPKPPSSLPSRGKKIAPKIKKCGRKTVKELLQERQQQFRRAHKRTEMTNDISLKQCISVSKSARQASDVFPKAIFKRSVLPSAVSFNGDDPKNQMILDGATPSYEKTLRPRHYDMSELQIGFLKFLYDFPVCRCNQPDLKTDGEARIVVPFRTITSISLKDRMIYLTVDSTPHFSLTNTRASEEDCWRHFLKSSFDHKVVLRKRQASKLKSILCEFDERFISLTESSHNMKFEREFDLSPVSFKKRFYKNRKLVVRRLPEANDKSLLLNRMCSCRTNCRSIRCSCVKAAKSCNSRGVACQCINCNNPLNVLEAIGLDIHFSLKDSCLFQNIYQIPDLPTYLLREVRLDCCNSLTRVQDCIPGTVLCPNINCNASLEFSWCQKRVSYPEFNPRNHCSFCGQCCFSNGRHCHVCKKCYAISSKSNQCPTCLAENTTRKQLCPQRSLNTFCYDKKMCRSSFKPQIIVLDSSTLRNKSKLPEESSSKLHCNQPNPNFSSRTNWSEEMSNFHHFKTDHQLREINKIHSE